MRDHRMGCISAMLEPHSTKPSACSASSVAAHRLVDAEGAHEAGYGGGHAVARIGIEVVGAEAGFSSVWRRHSLPTPSTGPRPNMPIPLGPLAFRAALHFSRHDVESLIPADGGELAVLVETCRPSCAAGWVRRSLPYMILERK